MPKKATSPPPKRERDRQTDRHMLSKVVMVRRHHRQSICFPRVYTAQPWARHSTDSRCRTHTGRMPWLNSANVKQDQWQPHSLYSDCPAMIREWSTGFQTLHRELSSVKDWGQCSPGQANAPGLESKVTTEMSVRGRR